MSRWPARIEIREVGPRYGLQNEEPVAIADRVRLIDALSGTGLRRIEASAFVSPAAIPPMAGAEDVMAVLPVEEEEGRLVSVTTGGVSRRCRASSGDWNGCRWADPL